MLERLMSVVSPQLKPEQAGVLPGRAMTEQVLVVLNAAREAIHKNSYVPVAFLDFKHRRWDVCFHATKLHAANGDTEKCMFRKDEQGPAVGSRANKPGLGRQDQASKGVPGSKGTHNAYWTTLGGAVTASSPRCVW